MQSFILAAAALSAVVSGFVLPRQANSTCPSTYPSKAANTSTDAVSAICGSTTFTNYTVASGDTLTSIAEQFDSGICDIATANNIENINLIEPGQVLTIPANCVTPDNTSCNVTPVPEATETCVPGVGSSYDVRSGDTLTSIAASFNITLDALVAENPQIEDIDVIDVAQIIFVPICPDSLCEGVGTRAIQSGDTFFDLAQTFGTTVGQIESLNYGVDPTKLEVGQIVIFPVMCHNGTLA